MPRAQPVWKLYTTGAAGSQSLTGLPLIHRLSRRPDVSVWPFADLAQVTLAEIYPSLLAPEVTAEMAAINSVTMQPKAISSRANSNMQKPNPLAPMRSAAIKHEVQVRLLSRALQRLGQTGTLDAMLSAPPPGKPSGEPQFYGAAQVRFSPSHERAPFSRSVRMI